MYLPKVDENERTHDKFNYKMIPDKALKMKMRRPLQFVPISREKTIKRVANYYEGHRPGSGWLLKYGGWIVVE